MVSTTYHLGNIPEYILPSYGDEWVGMNENITHTHTHTVEIQMYDIYITAGCLSQERKIS